MKASIATILVAGLALPAVAAPIQSPELAARTPGGRSGGGHHGSSAFNHGNGGKSGNNSTNGNYGNYGSYGTYSNYPTSYNTYGTYPASYSTYGTYPSSYSTYGTYKRRVGWAKSFFGHSSADVEVEDTASVALAKRRVVRRGPVEQEFKFDVSKLKTV